MGAKTCRRMQKGERVLSFMRAGPNIMNELTMRGGGGKDPNSLSDMLTENCAAINVNDSEGSESRPAD